ncbi:MAG: LysM peptidoglycan-binding domain-containing protein [Flavobacteriales bacterium]|nr:LysM peptidoglycan-binding domain-containing protein [Flavobacteriales bacterium]
MIRRLLLLVLFAGAFTMASLGQEIRTVDGEKYIVHTVEAGQTLFGISRHFAVELDAITEANPGAEQGLSIGQVLLIPRKAQSKKDLKTAPELNDGELLHTVTKKETLYGIARKYGVDQEDLRRLNPDLSYGLRIGMVLRIQVARSTAAPPMAVLPAVMDRDEFHRVLPGETLYALSKQFGVSADSIKAANGGLPEGLKAGIYVRIPRGTKAVTDSTIITEALPRPSLSMRRRIAVLLPFTATAQDTAATGEDGERLASVTEAAVEFRAGMAMALDSLQAQGLNADVLVFDTGMKPAQWDPVLKSDAMRGMDMYIGPFHRAAIESLARVSGGAPIICPVPQSNKVILGNPSVSKAIGGRTDRLKLMARYIAFHHAAGNVMLLKPDIFSERDVQRLMERELQQALLAQPAKLRDSLIVVPCGRRDVAAAVAKLDPVRPNILVVPSEDVEFVTTVLTKFMALVPKYKITVYGLDAWRNMSTLDVNALMKLNVHLPANAFIDRSSPAVNAFVAAYRTRFRNEPGEYAFLGYDVATYFIRAEMQFGEDFPKFYAQVHAKPLYLDLRMQKLGPENGWSNSSAVMLEYLPGGLLLAK